MRYYAYIPREDGSEPLGSANRMLMDLKTPQGAIKRAKRYMGDNIKVFSFTNFFRDSTFKLIYDGTTR